MLTQAEINALITSARGSSDEAVSASARQAQAKQVKTYDFRRPDKFSKDQLRTLHSIHEAFGRLAGAKLSQRLRFTAKPLSVTLADTSQMIFSEYVAGLTLPSYLVTLRVPELDPDAGKGKMLLDLDLPLAKAWIDRQLGGPGMLPVEREEPTGIEGALILRLRDEVLEALGEGWSNVAQITPQVFGDPDLTPTMLRIAAPSDVVAVLAFEVRYDIGRTAESIGIPVSAPMSICIPHAMLEPVLPRLSASSWYAQAQSTVDTTGRADLTATLQNVEVPLTAVLGGVELSVDELASLKPGDVIRFGERADHPVRLSVMDQAMAWGVPGRVGDRVALRLLTPLQQLMEA
jgi:flagellar motor switch protein FliM